MTDIETQRRQSHRWWQAWSPGDDVWCQPSEIAYWRMRNYLDEMELARLLHVSTRWVWIKCRIIWWWHVKRNRRMPR